MPFVSEAQRAWMHANDPAIAAEWEDHTPKGTKLPVHAHRKPTSNAAKRQKIKRRKNGVKLVASNPLRTDPSRTLALRVQMTDWLGMRFKRLRSEIVKAVKQIEPVFNAFCATGPGGGIDPHCGIKKEDILKKIDELPLSKPSALQKLDWIEGTSITGAAVPFPHVNVDIAMKVRDAGEVADDSKLKHVTIDLDKLMASQSDVATSVLKDKVLGFSEMKTPFIVKMDGKYIIADGHHTLVVQKLSGFSSTGVKLLDLDALKKAAPKTGPKTLSASDTEQVQYLQALLRRSRGGTAVKIRQQIKDITGNAQHDAHQIGIHFRNWLEQSAKALISAPTSRDFIDGIAKQAYMKGVRRAFDDAKGNKIRALTIKPKPTNNAQPIVNDDPFADFLNSAFKGPVSKDRIKVIADQMFGMLDGITEDMAESITDLLIKGLQDGTAPAEIAKEMADAVDISEARAGTIARTEIVRAHADGQIQSMRDMGAKELGVEVEWTTAQDERVCPECDANEGAIYSLDEAEGVIPFHPNCRCAWVPANVGEDGGDSLDGLEVTYGDATENAFCPTGPGGGTDDSCSSKGGGKLHVSDKMNTPQKALGAVTHAGTKWNSIKPAEFDARVAALAKVPFDKLDKTYDLMQSLASEAQKNADDAKKWYDLNKPTDADKADDRKWGGIATKNYDAAQSKLKNIEAKIDAIEKATQLGYGKNPTAVGA